jgi:hypothetical protein
MENNSVDWEESECSGIFGWIFGHKFQQVYIKEEAYKQLDKDQLKAVDDLTVGCYSYDIKSVVTAAHIQSSRTTYIHSICKRCGRVIK